MDQSTIELMRKMIRAGYVDVKGLNYRTLIQEGYEGVPQGSILSPILCNIYFDDFDNFVENMLIPLNTKGIKRAENLEYKRAQYFNKNDKLFISKYLEVTKAIFNVKHDKLFDNKLS